METTKTLLESLFKRHGYEKFSITNDIELRKTILKAHSYQLLTSHRNKEYSFKRIPTDLDFKNIDSICVVDSFSLSHELEIEKILHKTLEAMPNVFSSHFFYHILRKNTPKNLFITTNLGVEFLYKNTKKVSRKVWSKVNSTMLEFDYQQKQHEINHELNEDFQKAVEIIKKHGGRVIIKKSLK